MSSQIKVDDTVHFVGEVEHGKVIEVFTDPLDHRRVMARVRWDGGWRKTPGGKTLPIPPKTTVTRASYLRKVKE